MPLGGHKTASDTRNILATSLESGQMDHGKFLALSLALSPALQEIGNIENDFYNAFRIVQD
jgi:hypothetical protein